MAQRGTSSFHDNLVILANYYGSDLLDILPVEQRLAGLNPEQRLAGLSPEQVLSLIKQEQLLSLIKPEQIFSMVNPEQLLAEISPEQRKLLFSLLLKMVAPTLTEDDFKQPV